MPAAPAQDQSRPTGTRPTGSRTAAADRHGDARDGPGQPTARRQLELFAHMGADSVIIAPLRARRQVLGALTVARTSGRAALCEQDLALVDDFAHRIALAVDNARLHQETQRIAERLQRSLLPELPRHLQLTARYTPSRTTAEVGGDRYDSFLLPNGATTLIIGDVTGHDLRSAVTMSHLRNMLRGIACDRQGPPGHILHRLDRAYLSLYGGATASCVYALLTGPEAGPWTLEYANAGHPPPLLITYEGNTRYLDDGHGPLLGVDPRLPRPHAAEAPRVCCESGSCSFMIMSRGTWGSDERPVGPA
ncbi:PP2C family protein-serine/threonine phosphatase [Streptomyces sp. NPDC020731]|uniref:PP2C family protein-serine/threonine phosphatase n=1 Tax=Streptomyces sp. NPDC020731 TaxID=3365085 RepID=UPI0037876927